MLLLMEKKISIKMFEQSLDYYLQREKSCSNIYFEKHTAGDNKFFRSLTKPPLTLKNEKNQKI